MNSLRHKPDLTGAAEQDPVVRIEDAMRAASRVLREAGVESAELDARLLVAYACGLSHEDLVAQVSREMSRDERQRLDDLVRRRRSREPVSRVLGTRAFWSHDFAIGPATLDPRPDTETLIELALELVAEGQRMDEPLAIADIGTGSGCILLSLLSELPHAWGVGGDLSPEALCLAVANARALGLAARARFVRASWLDGLAGPFDLVVANPPYIPSAEIASLSPEVALYDPVLALDGGGDGLEAYRGIAARLADVLAPGGWAVFEVGEGQAHPVAELFSRAGFDSDNRFFREKADLAGVIRGVAVMQR